MPYIKLDDIERIKQAILAYIRNSEVQPGLTRDGGANANYYKPNNDLATLLDLMNTNLEIDLTNRFARLKSGEYNNTKDFARDLRTVNSRFFKQIMEHYQELYTVLQLLEPQTSGVGGGVDSAERFADEMAPLLDELHNLIQIRFQECQRDPSIEDASELLQDLEACKDLKKFSDTNMLIKLSDSTSEAVVQQKRYEGRRYHGVPLQHVDFSHVSLKATSFNRANLTKCNFVSEKGGVSFAGVSLRGATLTDCYFERDGQRVNFQGVKLDKHTEFVGGANQNWDTLGDRILQDNLTDPYFQPRDDYLRHLMDVVSEKATGARPIEETLVTYLQQISEAPKPDHVSDLHHRIAQQKQAQKITALFLPHLTRVQCFNVLAKMELKKLKSFDDDEVGKARFQLISGAVEARLIQKACTDTVDTLIVHLREIATAEADARGRLTNPSKRQLQKHTWQHYSAAVKLIDLALPKLDLSQCRMLKGRLAGYSAENTVFSRLNRYRKDRLEKAIKRLSKAEKKAAKRQGATVTPTPQPMTPDEAEVILEKAQKHYRKRYSKRKLREFRAKLLEAVEVVNGLPSRHEHSQTLDTATRYNAFLKIAQTNPKYRLFRDLGLEYPRNRVTQEGVLKQTGFRIVDVYTVGARDRRNPVAKHYDEVPHLTKKGSKFYASTQDATVSHTTEARNIFFSTMWEKFKGTVSTFFKKIGIHLWEGNNYYRRGETDQDIYANDTRNDYTSDAAISSWERHASNRMRFPIQVGDQTMWFVVGFDLVNGHLNGALYRSRIRKGDIQKGGVFHAISNSHNHMDHLSNSTNKKVSPQGADYLHSEGDQKYARRGGFTQAHPHLWWDQTVFEVTDEAGENHTQVKMTFVPANHWSQRADRMPHKSAFGGMIVETVGPDGKKQTTFHAGDSGLLTDEASKDQSDGYNQTKAITDHYDIDTYFAPGGPDENRKDMASTHQSSSDGLLMHFRLLKAKYDRYYREGMTMDEFLQNHAVQTIFMHTKTYKLGNLHADDTQTSVTRVQKALAEGDEGFSASLLKAYEEPVVKGIQAILSEMKFGDDAEALTTQDASNIIQRFVRVPKIGERTNLGEAFNVAPQLAAEAAVDAQSAEPNQQRVQTYEDILLNMRAKGDYEAALHANHNAQLPEQSFERAKHEMNTVLRKYSGKRVRFWRNHSAKVREMETDVQRANTFAELRNIVVEASRATVGRNRTGHFSELLKKSMSILNQQDERMVAQMNQGQQPRLMAAHTA